MTSRRFDSIGAILSRTSEGKPPVAGNQEDPGSYGVPGVRKDPDLPGTRPIPALMAPSSQAHVLRPQLLKRGSVRFGDDDANPASPEIHYR